MSGGDHAVIISARDICGVMSFVGSYVTATYADFKALTIILLIELSQTIVLHRNYQLE